MTQQVPIAEAKKSFADLIRRAEAGEEIELTRYGRPVARLIASVPVQTGGLIGCMAGAFEAPDPGEDDDAVRELLSSGALLPE